MTAPPDVHGLDEEPSDAFSQVSSPRGWEPVDLGPFLDGTFAPIKPTLGHRTDGVALLYPGMIHWLAGEPDSGKSMTAMALAAQAIADGQNVFYIDYEVSIESASHGWSL